MSAYVLLYLLMPLINKCIEGLTRQQHLYAMVVGVGLFSIWPTITNQSWQTGVLNLPIFITLFFMGAYFGRYNTHISNKKLIIFCAVGILGIVGSEVMLKTLTSVYPFYFVWEMYKTPVVLLAIAIFLLFVDIEVKLPVAIARASESVFGIYLLHIGRLADLIFGVFFDNSSTYGTIYLPLQLLLTVTGIFVVGVVIDQLRIKLIEKPLFRKMEHIISLVDNVCVRLFDAG